MRAYRAFGIVAAGLITAVLVGCGESSAPQTPQPEPQKKVAKALDMQPIDIGETEEYTYQPAGKRDPFRPHVSVISPEVTKSAAPADKVKKPLTPLEELDVIEWKLIAIVQTEEGQGKPVAMVEDPQGRGYLVEEGTAIGKWGGKVDEILPDKVKVVESYASGSGAASAVQEIFLQLRSAEEEEESVVKQEGAAAAPGAAGGQ